jgi:hypothetical protein
MKLSPSCSVCDRLAVDYEQTLAEHADFVAEYEAALQARQYRKSWELRLAVQGSEILCRMAQQRLETHCATHLEGNAA